jgi:CPA1 family monovalent cation:H+ antiporter
LQEESVWPVVDFLLETFVFAYIGLQLKFVLFDLADSDEPGLTRTLVAAGVLLAVAIVFRVAAVYLLFGRWTLRFASAAGRSSPTRPPNPLPASTPRSRRSGSRWARP